MTWEAEARHIERKIAVLDIGITDLDEWITRELAEVGDYLAGGTTHRPIWQVRESIVRRWARRRGMVVERDALAELREAMNARHPVDLDIVAWTADKLRADRG